MSTGNSGLFTNTRGARDAEIEDMTSESGPEAIDQQGMISGARKSKLSRDERALCESLERLHHNITGIRLELSKLINTAPGIESKAWSIDAATDLAVAEANCWKAIDSYNRYIVNKLAESKD